MERNNLAMNGPVAQTRFLAHVTRYQRGEMNMRGYGTIASGALAAFTILPIAAQAQSLKVVEVGAPAINCVFQTDCIIPVSDTIGTIALPFISPGTAWLQSRTFAGEPGAPGAGTTGYEYRVSMTQASGPGCVLGLNLNFGPSKQLPYLNNQLADVYVVTTGGLGTVGIQSAVRNGDAIQFTFKAPVCADGPPDIKKTTFFFGLAATAAPMHVNASVWAIGDPALLGVDARVPTHSVSSDPPGGL
jgi:hypothetical protein